MPIAFVRNVSATINDCELTHMEHEAIDLAVARTQHDLYVQALRDMGCDVHELPQLDHQPDAVFVEDTAVVVPELAVLTNPGAPSVEEAKSNRRETCSRSIEPSSESRMPDNSKAAMS